MSGNQVKAEAVAAGVDDWAMQRKMNHRRMIEEAEAQLMKIAIAQGDVAGIDRQVRAVTNLAKAVVAVEAIKAARSAPLDEQHEDEMGGRRDEDPAALEALRARVMERYDQFAAEIEYDGGGAGDIGLRDAPAVVGGESASGEAPEAAEIGLEHLADVGWSGRWQDLRGGALAA
jgi:hypothetical protein